jgi:hypothetical protein
MTKAAVGFYWTLPAPWAGFTDLPDDIDEAAAASRTIRYQRELIRRYAAGEGFRLIREQVFLELEPDRGSDQILGPLEEVEAICLKEAAVLLYVEFAELGGWRRHHYLVDWARRERREPIEILPIYPSPLEVSGFDPHQHFSAWRQAQSEWSARKPERTARALSRAQQLQIEGRSQSGIADQLNSEDIPSPTGKRWTADNVRKLLKSAGEPHH